MPFASQSIMENNNQDLGMKGEALAAAHLKKKGFRILESRYRTPFGEIDLIAEQNQVIHFIEVKCRRHNGYGGALAAITPAKCQHLKRAIQWYLIEKPECRKQFLQVTAIGIRIQGEAVDIQEEPILLSREF